MQSIFDLINEIVSTLDRFDTGRCLGKICTNLLAVTGGSACFIFLSDSDGGLRDVTRAKSGSRPECGMPVSRGRELAAQSLSGGRWLAWEDWRGSGEVLEGGPQPVLCLPLKAFENVIGALTVVRWKDPFSEREVGSLQPIANIVALAIPRGELDGFANLAEICVRFLEEKDSYTHGHSMRVMKYSLWIADAVGLDPATRRELRLCALLHDIGKVIVKGSILSKKGALSRTELHAIRMHPGLGSAITSKIYPSISDKILAHHERYDGRGYPSGMKGEDIPWISRIIALADALDAMTSRRPYRHALSLEKAVGEIRRHSGTQFDPRLVDALIGLYETGSLEIVRL